MTTKLSEELLRQLKRPDASDLLEVVIELRKREEPPPNNVKSRQEKIAALKESFNHDVAPIEDAVRGLGGELTGYAWINRTLRARVPVESLERLSAYEQIAKIDVPHKLTLD